MRKHSTITYDEYVKIYKVPPVPIIKHVPTTIEIPPLSLAEEDSDNDHKEGFLSFNDDQSFKTKSGKISKGEIPTSFNNELPEILELERDDSKWLENKSPILPKKSSEFKVENNSKRQAFEQDDQIPDKLSCLDLDEDFKLDDNPTFPVLDDFIDDNNLKSANKTNIKNKIYQMNKDGNYSSTTALSRKESFKFTTKNIEVQDTFKNDKDIELDDFNPKMFKYSLQASLKTNDQSKKNIRKYSEPVHSNGGKTIFGHLENLNLNKMNITIQNRRKTFTK